MLKIQPGIYFFLALYLGLAQPVVAEENAENIAEDSAPAGQQEDESAAVEDSREYRSISDADREAIEYYQELIKKLEIDGGVYDSQLSEVIIGLGNLYQSTGRHADAIELFERAFHITRVNAGLYALDQLAILEELIESNRKLKDWEALDSNYHNLLWISKRHYGENNPALLALIDRVGRWHLQAWELDQGSTSFSHLVDAEQLYKWAVDIIEADGGRYDLRLINALYGIALTNYQIASKVSSSSDFDDIRSGFREARSTRRALEIQRAREDFIIRSFIKGRDALNQVIEIQANNPVLPVETQAMAMTHLGDWYLLFNKRNSAAKTYQDAYSLMRTDGIEQKQIDLLFGQPRTLPAIRLPVEKPEELIQENPPYVLASFDVSPSGKPQNIQIIESSKEDDVSYRRKAKRSIAATRFRPRYEDGKPVLTTGMNLRYIFTDEAEN